MDAVNNLANVFNRLIKHCLPRKLYIIVLQYCIVKVLCYSFTFVSTMVCLIAKTAKQAEPVFTLLTNCNQPVANGPVSAARPTDSVSAAYQLKELTKFSGADHLYFFSTLITACIFQHTDNKTGWAYKDHSVYKPSKGHAWSLHMSHKQIQLMHQYYKVRNCLQ